MRKDISWRDCTEAQKRSRVRMQIMAIEREADYDLRHDGPCTPDVVTRWLRSGADRIERRNGQPMRRPARRKLER